MELTNDIIQTTYKHARILLKGRRDIDAEDLAHEAMVKMATCKQPPAEYLENKIRMIVLTAFRDHYTNKTTRKNNILLDAVHAEFDMQTIQPDTTSAKDEFIRALKIVFKAQPTQFEILMLILQGMTIKEIARMRGTSTKAVDQLKQKARKTIAAALGMAA